MSKLGRTAPPVARGAARARTTSAVTTTSVASDTRTALGGAGWTREPRGELFLTATGAFPVEKSFHENPGDRANRINTLARTIALEEDGVDWLTGLVRYARGEANMRAVGLMIAIEATAARAETGLDPGTRHLARAAIGRADEIGTMLKLWSDSYNGATRLPNSLKRAMADAAVELYSEYSALKYDTPAADNRFGHVLRMVRPTPRDARQDALFRWLIERSHEWVDGESRAPGRELAVIHARRELEAVPTAARRALLREKHGVPFADRLKAAGATWEWLAGWLNDGKGMDADAWAAVLPSMGYMARLRNIRNVEQAGVPASVLDGLAGYLMDPERVARSKQLPMRFLSAYKEMENSLRWAWPLEQGLEHSLDNVPVLPGRTLILVDLSWSMFHAISDQSKLAFWEAAAIFGTALARRAEHADVVAYGSSSRVVKLDRTTSVLSAVRKHFGSDMGGTDTFGAVSAHYRRGFHDRVVILTDEQHSGYRSPTAAVDPGTPVYTWNLAGYQAGHGPSGEGNRHTFGGLSDAAFRTIPLIEAGVNVGWPWETRD